MFRRARGSNTCVGTRENLLDASVGVPGCRIPHYSLAGYHGDMGRCPCIITGQGQPFTIQALLANNRLKVGAAIGPQ